MISLNRLFKLTIQIKEVILFEEQNNNIKFKSIYIKRNKHLKVNDLREGQMIFNEVL